MIIRWFASRTVRQATYLRRQVKRLLNEQRDLLSHEAIEAVSTANASLGETVRSGMGKETLRTEMARVESTASRHLIGSKHPVIRENVKEALVAVVLIMSITTFFVQLTKIPTGSLQPTLFGITYENLKDKPEVEIPNRLVRFFHYWLWGVSYFEVRAKDSGYFQVAGPPETVLPFVKRQKFLIGDTEHTIWFPSAELLQEAGLHRGQYFDKGDLVLRMKSVAGDHLLVDRLTYNFRRPERGEIIVFKTDNVPELPRDQLYIKRLVAFEKERVRIGNDQHLVVDGERLNAATPHFERVYTFGARPRPRSYFGHANGTVAGQYHRGRIAPLFPDGKTEHVVAEDHLLVMGDNTLNSSDSRAWGDLPEENVTGRAWFVYWPISSRFGWGPR